VVGSQVDGAGLTGALAMVAVLPFAAGVATLPADLGVAALAAALIGGFAAFGVVFVVDGFAAMSVATPVAVLGGTESRRSQQYKLFAHGLRLNAPLAQCLICELNRSW